MPARLAKANDALADLSDVDGDWAVVSGLTCSHQPVPYPWATQARTTGALPGRAALDAAVRWLAARSPQWTVNTRTRYADAPAFRGLAPWLVLPAFKLREPSALELPGPTALIIRPARTTAEFLAVFGGELAPLVTTRHLAAPGYHHLVGLSGRRAEACAKVRIVAGTAYVSAVTVLPDERGHGFGRAISAAAGRLALRHADLVWLHAAGEVGRLYQRLGFRHVDDHVLLEPVARS